MRGRGIDYGLANGLTFSLPVIGNSSTSPAIGALQRSQAWAAMAGQIPAARSAAHYAANALYVYPEHRDHDPERGDLFSAMTPYVLISQGSSGSDLPLVRAALMAAAALPPDTQARAVAEGLLAPSLQMLIRRAMPGIGDDDAAYLGPAAHPTAFDGTAIDLAALVSRAQAMAPEDLPALVVLKVAEDFRAAPGRDYLAANLNEVLFTTPQAVARAWRSFA